MSNVERFKYECQDCGMMKMLGRWELHRRTDKPHCQKCGGTFFEPVSHNAKTDQFLAGMARRATKDHHSAVGDAHKDMIEGNQELNYKKTVSARLGGKAKRRTR